MTLSEIRLRIWDALGKPTNLDPSTDSQYNGGPLLDYYVNEGQRRIAAWCDPITKKKLKMDVLYGSVNYQPTIVTGTVDSWSMVSPYVFRFTVTSPTYTVLSLETEYYTNWLITIGEEVRRCVYSRYTPTGIPEAGYVFLDQVLETEPTVGDTVTLVRNFDWLLPEDHAFFGIIPLAGSSHTESYPEGNFVEVLSVTDLTNERVLEKVSDRESFPDNLKGTPTKWKRFGNKIVYDRAVDTELWFKMEYYRLPTDMSADSDEPTIPVVYHYAIVLWGIWYGYMSTGEASRAQLAWNNLVNMLRSTYSQREVENERIHAQGQLKTRW